MMDTLQSFYGRTKYWWAILVLGIAVALLGLWMLFFPIAGFDLLAMIFGWALIGAGIFELVVATSMEKKIPGWGWWLASGIIDILIGLVLVINQELSMEVLPYFFAFIFLFKGIQNIVAGFSMTSQNKYWWLYLLNGVLMLILSWIFFSSVNNPAFIIDFLVSIVFIYWGAMTAFISFDVKPAQLKK
ncbi:MAG: DUF308 domain-containing protein [Bacteroidales bacterium]|nr:DUF308 domain-containing protein [Bacteroidales bacterium]